MQLTETLKISILTAIQRDFDHKKRLDPRLSQTRHANCLGINPTVYSRLIKGDTDRVLGEGEWIRVGMELGVDLNGLAWRPGATATFNIIYTQLEVCRDNALSSIFCDDKGIGKTYTAKRFAQDFPNVAYVDCSQCHTKRELVRQIARKFGFDYKGRLMDVRANLVDNILTLDKPLLILDEAGDLSYEAWLEIKSLWNTLENVCGFYMMGANGLRAKINRQMVNEKVGYEEIFDRYGDRYQYVTSDLNEADKAGFCRSQAETVLKANLPNISAQAAKEILNACNLNLRRLRIEIIKYKNVA